MPAIHRFGSSRRGSRLTGRRGSAARGNIFDASHADAAGAPPLDLGRDHHDRLLVRLSPDNAGFPAAHVRFIDLHFTVQKVTPWLHHRPPQLVEPRPGRLVAAQTENALHASALTPCFWFVTYHIAWNQSRSGLRVPSKIVPAVGDVWRWHLAHRNWPRPVVHASVSAQDGHRKPSGQRTRRTNSAHAASDANHSSNSFSVRG